MRRRVPKTKTQGHYEQLVEHPFDSGIKRMTVAYVYHPADGAEKSEEGHVLVLMKGAFVSAVNILQLGQGTTV